MGFPDYLALADRSVRRLLGGAVTYAPSSGSPVVVQGVFDANYVRVDSSVGGVGVSSVGPAVFLRVEDLPSDPTEDNATITVNGVAYSINEAKPDGLGGVSITLHKVS